VAVAVTRLVGGESTVREAMVSSVHLPVKARLETGAARGRGCAVVLLHAE
jgi:hypothetical protein